MFTRKKVLVICKSTVGQLYLGLLLNRIWYEPILARNATDAMLIDHTAVSLVLLDSDTAESGRNDAIALLKKSEHFRKIPLIAVLSAGDPALSEHLLTAGCAAVITKPIDISLAHGILGTLSGEARKSPRAPVRIRVEIEEQTPAPALFSINISEGGIYLRTPDPLPEDTLLHLSFTLPQDQEKIRLSGKVVRNIPLGIRLEEEPGMGINFTGISDGIRTRIRNFVTWSLSNDLEWETTF